MGQMAEASWSLPIKEGWKLDILASSRHTTFAAQQFHDNFTCLFHTFCAPYFRAPKISVQQASPWQTTSSGLGIPEDGKNHELHCLPGLPWCLPHAQGLPPWDHSADLAV